MLGAGVVGVATAWYLTEAGHEVTVIERAPGPALGTSFANAGQISPGLAAPWAGPGTPRFALRALLSRDAPFRFGCMPDREMRAWLRRFLGECNAAAYARNKARMVRLAEYSRDRLRDLRAATGIDYDGAARGLLHLFREQRQLDGAGADMAVLGSLGVPHRLLDRAGCVAQEPALAGARVAVAGGLLLPGDETGDANLFAARLAARAEAAGAVFRYGVAIRGLEHEGGVVTGVWTEAGRFGVECAVVSLGVASAALVAPLGIRLPVYPVKGYSLTMDIAEDGAAPLSTVTDESLKVGITRLGNRLRVGGTAELAGYSARLPQGRRRPLDRAVTDLFPRAGDLASARLWTGLRPMTPDGTPVVGGTPYPNLFLNTGHGTLGWTMACGSGAMIADLVSRRTPEISPAEYEFARYARQ